MAEPDRKAKAPAEPFDQREAKFCPKPLDKTNVQKMHTRLTEFAANVNRLVIWYQKGCFNIWYHFKYEVNQNSIVKELLYTCDDTCTKSRWLLGADARALLPLRLRLTFQQARFPPTLTVSLLLCIGGSILQTRLRVC